MKSFNEWLNEAQDDIKYAGSGKYAGMAWVTFYIRGKKYEYGVDPPFTVKEPVRLRRGKKLSPSEQFRSYIEKRWYGKALNVIKEYGKLLSIDGEEPEEPESPKVQQRLF
jgi:hypothetical protein